MPNTHVPAAGEAMPAVEGMHIFTGRFSRRAMLIGAIASIPAMAGALAAEAPADDMPDAEFAALDWKPWEHYEGEFVPPTNDEWIEAINPTLVAIRLAWAVMYKTKPELITMLNEMDKEPTGEGETLAAMMVGQIEDARIRIEALHDTLCGAFARCAVAVKSTGAA
ncbi:hypothetical protein [Mesorhizobium sp. M7A.F.Ca.US.008.03.1.1]|uniref:hypothetical protein n=1 Tax=Mesorhizobium sp. M7A.F.Ca.US.008.03.1.1 TaxID=2496742 RepID=UPI000FCA4797|nr:hypothetical protein [Mesorhizobium sp. M7A.F.Ca.US.008.03.1.1]RUW62107.1 hypothetical protein EOA16_10240 [Mesorhizobium sp. M7A.F.Ca.US.008.03.1.1]